MGREFKKTFQQRLRIAKKKKKKNLKSCSTSLVVRKMQIKSLWDATSHLWGWIKLKTMIVPNVGNALEQLKLLYLTGENVKSYNHFEKQFDSFLKQAYNLYLLAIPLLGIYL